MSELRVPNPVAASPTVSKSTIPHVRRIKIGEVARHFAISVDLLRLYEREGLLIPLKSSKGTRYFTERDYPWIATLLRLIREQGLNFAGIRRLLALIPCWDVNGCGEEHKTHCQQIVAAAQPCWIKHACCLPQEDCYACEVYRTASQCENLKALLALGPS